MQGALKIRWCRLAKNAKHFKQQINRSLQLATFIPPKSLHCVGAKTYNNVSYQTLPKADLLLPRLTLRILALCLCTFFWTISSFALEYRISGAPEAVENNIRATVDLLRVDDDTPLWRLEEMARYAPEQISKAMQPFGYYRPQIEIQQQSPDGEAVFYLIEITPGQAVTVRDLQLSGNHPSGKLPEVFQQWLTEWPMPVGSVLNQQLYEQTKQGLEQRAERQGYFQFAWQQHTIVISEDRLHADIQLAFETGRKAVFGSVSIQQERFTDKLLDRFIDIQAGERYNSDRLDRLRNDLSTSGYFDSVVVVEKVDRQQSPAVVNLEIQLQTRPPSTYSTKLGFGTDTGPRIQLGWDRHHVSRHGDRLNLAFGAQQQNSEFALRANYELPRGNDPDEFWFARGFAQDENIDFRLAADGTDPDFFPDFNANQRQIRLDTGLRSDIGRDSGWPLRQRLFVTYLFNSFELVDSNDVLPQALRSNNSRDQYVTALGASWDLRRINGSGFSTEGTRAQLRLSGALEQAISDISFAQLYLGVRHSRLLGDRHKVLLRGEFGYTEAETNESTIVINDREIELSVTQLPEPFRFQAGGDRSVRGYGFESLSNNRIGSNHLLSFSAEYEYRVSKDWSVAGFYDVGNAFNRFSDIRLRHGVGLGLRWYSLVGPVRLDIARGLDEPSDGLRLHITIGSPLL